MAASPRSHTRINGPSKSRRYLISRPLPMAMLPCGEYRHQNTTAVFRRGVTPASNSVQHWQAQERRQITVWADVSALGA
jgi:hypothetical protein